MKLIKEHSEVAMWCGERARLHTQRRRGTRNQDEQIFMYEWAENDVEKEETNKSV